MENVLKKMIRTELSKMNDKESSPEKVAQTNHTDPPEKKRQRTEGRLSHLLNKIRRKTDDSAHNVLKMKKIQVKWKRYCPISSHFKLVRSDSGGGMRIIEVPFQSSYTFGELKQAVIPLYFPPPAHSNQFLEAAENCQFHITAPDSTVMGDDEKLWDYIQDHGLVISKTTFVLTSRNNTVIIMNPFMADTCSYCDQKDYMTPFGTCLYCESMAAKSTLPQSTPQLPAVLSNVRPTIAASEASPAHQIVPSQTVSLAICTPATSQTLSHVQQPSASSQTVSHTRQLSTTSQTVSHTRQLSTASQTVSRPPQTSAESQSQVTPIPALTQLQTSEPIPSTPSQDVPQQLTVLQSEETLVSSGPLAIQPGDSNQQPLVVDHNTVFIQSPESTTIAAEIHRGMVLKDLMAIFRKEVTEHTNLNFHYINIRGEKEPGVGAGVSRDVYASFWSELSDGYFVGEESRVPFVRHDFFEEDWAVIGRIIVKAYKDINFFPTILARAFVEYCIFGKVNHSTMMESFALYLSSSDRELVEKALKDETEESFFQENDFLEFLDLFNCRSRVTKENVHGIIFEIAQQELVQKPHIMASAWRKELTPLVSVEKFSTPENISSIYRETRPTPKRIISILQFTCKDNAERECISHLKRFIKGLDNDLLKRFLKFCTGSESVIVDKLEVVFVSPESDFSRRPVAHTCGPLLELPNTYGSFPELRSDFINILKMSDWELNIV